MEVGTRLTESDFEKLENESWITREYAELAGLRRVTSQEGALLVSPQGKGNYDGIVFPNIWPGETKPREYSLRRDNPEYEVKADGTRKALRKYVNPPGRANLAYIPPGTDSATLKDVAISVYVTEGPKKAQALQRLLTESGKSGLILAFPGVWNWRGNVGKTVGPNGDRRDVKGPIPDLDLISWEGRKTVICFDTNTETDDSVRAARDKLASELESRKASAYFIRYPKDTPEQVNGVDDLLAVWGPERVQQLLDSALPFRDPKATPEELVESCLENLDENAKPSEVERALRQVSQRIPKVDGLWLVAMRNAVIEKLKSLGVPSAGKWADAVVSGNSSTSRDEDNRSGTSIVLGEIEPCSEFVTGSELLSEITASLDTHLVLPQHGSIAIALWVVHAHVHDAFYISPILTVESPEKRCAKTLSLELIQWLVPKPLPTSNITSAALFRTVETFRPTLLIDEADSFMRRNDELRGVLNSGHRKSSAVIVRAVGDDHEPKTFSTWCPKAIALIGQLPDTLEDRSIVIEMRRKKKDELVRPFRVGRDDKVLGPLAQKAARWAQDHFNTLKNAGPETPGTLNDRQADNWRPLLAIADLAGGEWPRLAREAALGLSQVASDDSARIQLLSDIRDIFKECDKTELTSGELITSLIVMEDRPWPEWKKGDPLTKTQLARLLKPFGVRPDQLWIDADGKKTKKRGYRLEWFGEVFARYLPSETVEPVEPCNDKGLSPVNETVEQDNSTTLKNDGNPHEQGVLPSLPDGKGDKGWKGEL
jgi:putative DNA primase/helicase